MPRLSTLFFAIALCLGWTNPAPAQTSAPLILQPNGSSTAAPTGSDANADAWPDDPFATLSDTELWLANTPARTVAALRWSAPDETIQTIDLEIPRPGNTDQHIRIEAPGVLAAPGEIAVLLIGVAADLESLINTEVSGTDIQPVDLLPGAHYLEISILISTDAGATFDEIDPARVQETPLSLHIGDLVTPVNFPAVLYEHPTYIASDPQTGLAPIAEAGAWTLVPAYSGPYTDPAPGDITQPAYLTAVLSSLSVFAPVIGPEVIPEEPEIISEETEETGTAAGDQPEILDPGETVLNGGETTTQNGGSETLTSDPDGDGGQMSLLLSSQVYLNFLYVGVERGTITHPFNTMDEALLVVEIGGTIFVANGDSNETQFIMDKPMFIQPWSPTDVARIGDEFACTPNESFTFTDFDITPSLSVVRDAYFWDPDVNAAEDMDIHLVPEEGFQAGAVWTKNKVLVERGFDTTFTVRLRNIPFDSVESDGISFVVQNDSADPVLSTGGDMGYSEIADSVAIEFDSHRNLDRNDPDDRHISAHSGGPGQTNSAHEGFSFGAAPTIQVDSGQIFTARVVYDAHEKTLKVYHGTVLRLTIDPFDIRDKMNLDNGRAYIGLVSTAGYPTVTAGPTELFDWSTTFPQSCEDVEWEKSATPFTHDGYHGDTFDHHISGGFLQDGDIIMEHVKYRWDDMAFTPQDIQQIETGADGLWIVESRGASGLWRGRYDPAETDGEFDRHAIEPDKPSIVTFAQNGGSLGTVEFVQTMTLARPNPSQGELPIDTGIIVAKHLITYRFVKIDPMYTADYPTCTFNPGLLIFHQVVMKRKVTENVYGVWTEAIKSAPLIPCP